MYQIKLNENERIGLNINTIISSIVATNIVASDNVEFQERIDKNIKQFMSETMLYLLSEEVKYDEMVEFMDNNNIIRTMILNGLKEKIEKELSKNNC